MRTARGLFERMIAPVALERALAATARGKRRRGDVAWMLFRREAVVDRLAARLESGAWRPRGFDVFEVRDPKPRLIARAPIEDRVVHTALVQQLEPVFAPAWTDDDFACRRGMGAHRARLRLLELVRRHRAFVHLDVARYFPSVDLEGLRAILSRRVRDERLLATVDRVLRSGARIYADPAVRRRARLDPDDPPPGRGLPIGTLTSQLFAAHLVLNELDHLVKRELKAPGYVRYVDDLFVFGRTRAEVRAWRDAIGEWLETRRGLRLKHPGARVRTTRGVLEGLGARITRQGIAPRAPAMRRLRGRVPSWVDEADPRRRESSIASTIEAVVRP